MEEKLERVIGEKKILKAEKQLLAERVEDNDVQIAELTEMIVFQRVNKILVFVTIPRNIVKTFLSWIAITLSKNVFDFIPNFQNLMSAKESELARALDDSDNLREVRASMSKTNAELKLEIEALKKDMLDVSNDRPENMSFSQYEISVQFLGICFLHLL